MGELISGPVGLGDQLSGPGPYHQLDQLSGTGRDDVRNCYDARIGKWVRDMSRDELLEFLRYVLNDNQRQRAECVSMMNALCDSKRSKGGAFMRWLFG
jgi:hypothetical protein